MYEGEDFEEEENVSEEGMSALWGGDEMEGEEGVEEEEDEEMLAYGHGSGYEEEEDELSRLSPRDVEQLVEKYLHSRRRAEELESENLKLTQRLIDLGKSDGCKDTLVIHVSPEMW